MNEKNSDDIFWNAYEKLPDEIRDVIFSETTVEIISKICIDNGLPEELISEVSKQTGRVLMGLLSPREFSITLELELDIDANQARKIGNDIDRLIFSHLRISLNKLYTENIADNIKVSDNKKEEGIENKEQPQKVEELKSDPKDPYREPLI
jgi:hypothetical protein